MLKPPFSLGAEWRQLATIGVTRVLLRNRTATVGGIRGPSSVTQCQKMPLQVIIESSPFFLRKWSKRWMNPGRNRGFLREFWTGLARAYNLLCYLFLLYLVNIYKQTYSTRLTINHARAERQLLNGLRMSGRSEVQFFQIEIFTCLEVQLTMELIYPATVPKDYR